MKKNILIAGGSGFFGKSILDYLNENDSNFNITIISRKGLDIQKYYNLNINQIFSDIRNIQLIDSYDYIIHAATPAIVDISDSEMRSIIIDGIDNLIKQVKNNNINTKILFASSGAVYGDYNRKVSEDDICNPKTVYGKSKLKAEQILLDSGIKCCIARCFAFSGKNLKQDIHFAIGNFIKNVKDGQDIMIKSDGSSIRSYLDQKDLAEWLLKILIDGKDKQIYNVGSDKTISIKDLAYLIKDRFNKDIKINILGEKNLSNSKSFYVPDINKIMSELGCKQTVSMIDSLQEMYNI